jgi:DNA-binding transcriptional LysR family regulator
MKIENISDLRVLLATARQGSLSAAARELEITPAAASAMLKRLEQQLGALICAFHPCIAFNQRR